MCKVISIDKVIHFYDQESVFHSVRCEIPQGLILGPLLFLIYK